MVLSVLLQEIDSVFYAHARVRSALLIECRDEFHDVSFVVHIVWVLSSEISSLTLADAACSEGNPHT